MKKRTISFTPFFLIACAAWYIAAKYYSVDFDVLSGVERSWLVLPALWFIYLLTRRTASTLSLMGLTVCVWNLLTANGVVQISGWILWAVLAGIFVIGVIVWIFRVIQRLIGSTFDTLTAEPCWRSIFVRQGFSFGSGEPFKSGQLTAVLGKLELDISKASVQNGAVMSCSSLLGKVRVIVPPDVKVKVYPVHLLGGTKRPRGDGNGKAISVKSTAILGRVEIVRGR